MFAVNAWISHVQFKHMRQILKISGLDGIIGDDKFYHDMQISQLNTNLLGHCQNRA